MAKLVPFQIGMTLSEALKVSKPLRDMYEGDDRIKNLINTAMALEGMPRHASTHAAGVVMTKEPVSDYVPLARNDEAIVCQYNMGTLEELGLLKMDFLGLRNLTVIDEASKMSGARIRNLLTQLTIQIPLHTRCFPKETLSGCFNLRAPG